LWQYFYFANKCIMANADTNCNLFRYFAQVHAAKANAWNLYGNAALSSVSYQMFVLNHFDPSTTDKQLLHTNMANYVAHHCKYSNAIDLLRETLSESGCKSDIILKQQSLCLLLQHAIDCKKLKLASIYQTRLAELIPSAKDNFFLYLKLMHFHSLIRFEHEQYMEASRIVNNLIAMCNQRSLQSMTIPFYLLLSEIHLRCHNEVTMIMSYVLKAWSLCKTYHFFHYLPECALFLSRLHLQMENMKQAFNLIQEYLPMILRKENYFIVEAYCVLAKCCCFHGHIANAIEYFHIARIWNVRLMKADASFAESCKAKELSREVYYYLARLYESIGDTANRDKAAQKMIDVA